jgi:hypothetical protein
MWYICNNNEKVGLESYYFPTLVNLDLVVDFSNCSIGVGGDLRAKKKYKIEVENTHCWRASGCRPHSRGVWASAIKNGKI